MEQFNKTMHAHRRYNPLSGEWVLVSPHRATRPWQGQQVQPSVEQLTNYDPTCYLCPGNHRASGAINENYEHCYVFDNDFPSLTQQEVTAQEEAHSLFRLQPERGINKVICFSPHHNLTLAEMNPDEISRVIDVWRAQYIALGQIDFINYVQIFENKGSIMGCSNPHPHGQIWAQSSLPTLVERTQDNLASYFRLHQRSLLQDYLEKELKNKERIISENEHFVSLVPFWATWPFETMIISKRHFTSIAEMTQDEINGFATILKDLVVRYDNLFRVSFPYSSGIHQAPTDGTRHPEWHFHMHFYPPLLRSSTIKKFMVGYEMLAEAQRDILPENSAAILRSLPDVHYKIHDIT